MSKLWVFGPDIDRTFEIINDVTNIGRSRANDIQIKDKTVSRMHLKIRRSGDRQFVMDLNSENGTFFDGRFLEPFVEVELKEGIPMAIGTTVICLGTGCIEQLRPYLDWIGITKKTVQGTDIIRDKRGNSNQRKLELLYKVSGALAGNLPVREALNTLLDAIFEVLPRIDRGAFVLLNPETGEIEEVIRKSTNPENEDTTSLFCEDVIRLVVQEKKSLAISNVQKEEESEIADTLRLLRIKSVMCLPLISGSQVIGVIYLDSFKGPHGFRQDDLTLFSDLCEQTVVAVCGARIASELSMVGDRLTTMA